MNFKLYSNDDNENTLRHILANRGLTPEQINKYCNLTENDIHSPLFFGLDLLEKGYRMLNEAVKGGQRVLVVVDSDCDGFTSAALIMNYIFKMAGDTDYDINNVEYRFHQGKQHGLEDMVEYILEEKFDLVIVPDGGSNDFEQHKLLKDAGINVLILDHHEAERLSEDAVVINNQLSDYPNKNLSGVGVTWQFCNYVDSCNNTHYADNFIDLVALGNVGDMMDLREPETRYLITKGLTPANIKNPFMAGMWQKNMFKLTEEPTAWGITFYIVPMINACNRSGSIPEKQVMFEAMLDYRAKIEIPSTKRGHKVGEMETICTQALRVATNVKRHQDDAVNTSMTKLITKIENENLLDHKVLLLLLEKDYMSPNIAGLVANKLMAKYQRPCCVLMKNEREVLQTEFEYSKKAVFPILHSPGSKINIYSGSARGCDIVGVTEFKDICEATECCNYAVGHQGAFGISIDESKIDNFINETDEVLKNIGSEPVFFVDYLWDAKKVDGEKILDIAELGFLWGTNMPESQVGVKNVTITSDKIVLMGEKKNTIKILLPNGVNVIKFFATEEDIKTLTPAEGTEIKVDLVGTCKKNEWNGEVSPQILLSNYEVQKKGWVF